MWNSNSNPSRTGDRGDPAAGRLDDADKLDRSIDTLAESPDPSPGTGLAPRTDFVRVTLWTSLPTRWYESARDMISPYLRQPLRAYTDVARDRPGSGFPGKPKSSDTVRDTDP